MCWSYANVDMRRFGAVCCRWHVAVLACPCRVVTLFACSFMSLFCLDLKLISTCVVLAPSTVDSSSSFLLIDLSFCLCIYMSACLSVYLSIYLSFFLSIHLSIYLSIYPFVCLSVCQPVAAAWRHSSMMSAVPVVVGLGVCLTFLPVAWPCGCLVVCMQLCSAVLWCLDLMLMSTYAAFRRRVL